MTVQDFQALNPVLDYIVTEGRKYSISYGKVTEKQIFFTSDRNKNSYTVDFKFIEGNDGEKFYTIAGGYNDTKGVSITVNQAEKLVATLLKKANKKAEIEKAETELKEVSKKIIESAKKAREEKFEELKAYVESVFVVGKNAFFDVNGEKQLCKVEDVTFKKRHVYAVVNFSDNTGFARSLVIDAEDLLGPTVEKHKKDYPADAPIEETPSNDAEEAIENEETIEEDEPGFVLPEGRRKVELVLYWTGSDEIREKRIIDLHFGENGAVQPYMPNGVAVHERNIFFDEERNAYRICFFGYNYFLFEEGLVVKNEDGFDLPESGEHSFECKNHTNGEVKTFFFRFFPCFSFQVHDGSGVFPAPSYMSQDENGKYFFYLSREKWSIIPPKNEETVATESEGNPTKSEDDPTTKQETEGELSPEKENWLNGYGFDGVLDAIEKNPSDLSPEDEQKIEESIEHEATGADKTDDDPEGILFAAQNDAEQLEEMFALLHKYGSVNAQKIELKPTCALSAFYCLEKLHAKPENITEPVTRINVRQTQSSDRKRRFYFVLSIRLYGMTFEAVLSTNRESAFRYINDFINLLPDTSAKRYFSRLFVRSHNPEFWEELYSDKTEILKHAELNSHVYEIEYSGPHFAGTRFREIEADCAKEALTIFARTANRTPGFFETLENCVRKERKEESEVGA